ncbi:hypothetical protein I4U23_004365 [Adineta vaga]|nr:hypothetical protein I4U23_004365 [Adineta vaga]
MCSSIIQHIAYATVFGLFSGGYVNLSYVLSIDIVGDEKKSDALGLLCLFNGIAIGTIRWRNARYIFTFCSSFSLALLYLWRMYDFQ